MEVVPVGQPIRTVRTPAEFFVLPTEESWAGTDATKDFIELLANCWMGCIIQYSMYCWSYRSNVGGFRCGICHNCLLTDSKLPLKFMPRQSSSSCQNCQQGLYCRQRGRLAEDPWRAAERHRHESSEATD